jgi:RNA-directed DNA polymerase
VELYARLRSRAVLHGAWAKVRSSGLNSVSERTAREIRQFDVHSLRNLDKIRDKLKRGAFLFEGEQGITLRKGKGKIGLRPLVLAPIANRVVRRGILDVLQGYGDESSIPRHRWNGISAVRNIMATPTSVGGIRNRDVPYGIALIDQAVCGGNHYFVRSDIKNFFTRIPKVTASEFIRDAVDDKMFADVFDQALATSLENHEELKERQVFTLFPDPEIGVAQGSALSALAGNIALREFDAQMNARGIVCIRYIDDFILLGPAESKTQAAYRSARRLLNEIGMDVYELTDAKGRQEGKVDGGNIYDGTDVLGYHISGRSRQPCKAACDRFLSKLDAIIKRALREMRAVTKGTSSSHQSRYHQTMVELHKVAWGWSQSFRHTTAKHVFASLDREIDQRISMLQREARGLISAGDVAMKRRILGVHLLSDTNLRPLPEVSTTAASRSYYSDYRPAA